MTRRTDHRYPLAPDVTVAVGLDAQGRLTYEEALPQSTLPRNTPVADMTWMLAIDYRAGGRWAMPAVTTWQGERECFIQYLEPDQSGSRLINLTGITRLDDVRLVAQRCQLAQDATLLGFTPPALSDGPLLILAPHPDDAELAAYGLYQRHHYNSWIVTLTAGERQKRLDRQYLPGLDDDSRTASRRKGKIRAWNSATTPLLANVPAERLIMLGYFNDTLHDLLEEPSISVPSYGDSNLRPEEFRTWNLHQLGSDAAPANLGELLLQDLAEILTQVKPTTVIVTHPEIDPHPDHVAAARACAQAMRLSGHQPERVLLYANHLKGIRGFPRGPAHAAAGVWPLNLSDSRLGPWRLYSETLNDETIRQKAVALDSMHDLRAGFKLDKRLKRWLTRRLSGLPTSAWKDYGHHDYFQTHLKAHEVFAVVDAAVFVERLI